NYSVFSTNLRIAKIQIFFWNSSYGFVKKKLRITDSLLKLIA
ncbi:MAG: hypothetical protein ACI9XR_002791, partial [Flavobacterium sp.]